MRKHVATVALAASVFGCGGDWFQIKRPDGIELLITALEVPDWADWEEIIKVKNTLYNHGARDVTQSFTVNFYLSRDEDYDDGTDVLIGTRGVDPIFEGAQEETEDTPVALPTRPASWSDGPHYIIAYADPDDRIVEIDYGEDNNTAVAGPITVYTPPDGVDLVMKYVTGPANAEWGQSILVDYTVRNRGTVNCTDDFEVSFYLSADEVFDGEPVDVLIGTDIVPKVLAGQTEVEGQVSATLPGSGADGSYYIIGVANSDFPSSGPTEVAGDMANDKASDETIYIAYLPNLQVVSVTPSTSWCYWGEQIDVTVRIQEARGYPTPPDSEIVVKLWLSQDTNIDDTMDLGLGILRTGSLLGTESSELTASVTINRPPVATGISYYIIAEVDPENVIMEFVETDNTGWNEPPLTATDPATITDPYELNNTWSQAYFLGSAPYTSLTAWIQQAGDEDWFSFTIPTVPANYYYIEVYLYPPMTEDYDLYVYDIPTDAPWAQSTLLGAGVSESIEEYWGHQAGTWYIRVKGKNISTDWSTTSYTLVVYIW